MATMEQLKNAHTEFKDMFERIIVSFSQYEINNMELISTYENDDKQVCIDMLYDIMTHRNQIFCEAIWQASGKSSAYIEYKAELLDKEGMSND